jgi:hypothetical protein
MAYFSNSTDGDVLEDQCSECLLNLNEDVDCPVHSVQCRFNYEAIIPV